MPKPMSAYPRIALERLRNQRLVDATFSSVPAAVGALGAVQAQDFSGACWGLAQRVRGAALAGVERAFDRGIILRTHVLRPTWHFLRPADARFLLELSRTSIQRRMAPYERKAGFTPRVIAKSHDTIARALEGGYRTRDELGQALAAQRIRVNGEGLGLLMMRAEVDLVVTSGPRRGKQHTYASFDARVPKARSLPREEALAELARRYFSTHGPALLADFAWWGGLTLADAKLGVAAAGSLAERVLDGRPYLSPRAHTPSSAARSSVLLLPNYDEYLISYKDYRPVFDPALASRLVARERLASHLLVIGGQVTGGWRRTLGAKRALVEAAALRKLTKAERDGVVRATEAFGRFLGSKAELALEAP